MPALRATIWNNGNPRSLSFRMRARRGKLLRDIIEFIYLKRGSCSIVDLGGSEPYWSILGCDYLRSRCVSVVLVNTDANAAPLVNADLFTLVEGDATSLPAFSDRQFDLCHSNSLIEHVGSWHNKKRMAGEAMRVASSYFVQTPNFWFPIEPHFLVPGFQFLPKPVRASLVMKWKLGWMAKAVNWSEAMESVESCDLLTRSDLKELFPNSTVFAERILLLTKSMMVVGGEAASAVRNV